MPGSQSSNVARNWSRSPKTRVQSETGWQTAASDVSLKSKLCHTSVTQPSRVKPLWHLKAFLWLWFTGVSKSNHTKNKIKTYKKTPHWEMKRCLFEVKKERNVAHHLLDNLHRHQSSRGNRSWAPLPILKLIEICCSLEPIHKIHQSHQDKWQLPHLQKGSPINLARSLTVVRRKMAQFITASIWMQIGHNQ